MTHFTKQLLLSLCSATLLLGACEDSMELTDSDELSDSTVQRIDRVGRPEITNFTLRLPDFKVAYNAEDSFAVSEENAPTYKALLAAGITAWDELDGQIDWTPEKLGAFATLLSNDYLVVDISKPCDVNTVSYLSIERSMALGTTYQDCGGRTPNDDVVDDYMTYLVGGFEAKERMSDGVDSTTAPASSSFPYLVRPH